MSTNFGMERGVIGKIEARALLKLRQPSRSQVVKCYVSDHTRNATFCPREVETILDATRRARL